MLSEMREKLPPSEKKVASFILENPTQAIKMTAVELGEARDADVGIPQPHPEENRESQWVIENVA